MAQRSSASTLRQLGLVKRLRGHQTGSEKGSFWGSEKAGLCNDADQLQEAGGLLIFWHSCCTPACAAELVECVPGFVK